MSIEFPNQNIEASIKDIATLIEENIFSGDLTEPNIRRVFVQESAFEMINRLIDDEWFTQKQLSDIMDENGVGHLPRFLIEVNELATAAAKIDLTKQELSELKANVGLVDIEHLISSIKEKYGT